MAYRWIKHKGQRKLVTDDEYKEITSEEASTTWFAIKAITILIILFYFGYQIKNEFGGWVLLGTIALASYISYKFWNWKTIIFIWKLIDWIIYVVVGLLGLVIIWAIISVIIKT
jgi:hypothetical protein